LFHSVYLVTQAGIATRGWRSARRCRCRTTMVIKIAKTHRQMTN